MRIVEKMLYGIVGLLGVMLFLIVLCHFNPSIAEQLGKSVQAKEQEAVPNELAVTGDIVTFPSSRETGLSDELVSKGYEIPQEDALEIPKKVAEKNGYTPVQDQGKQVSTENAQALAESLSEGNTGADYTYDELYYPYYYMLDDTGKAIYRQIHGNTQDVLQSFKPVEQINANQLKNAFTAVCNDHPELFWLNTAYAYKYAPNGYISEIDLSFNYTSQSLEEAKTRFEAAANEIIYGSRGLGDAYEIEVYVHDQLAQKITYDLNAPINQSAYSALVQNRTVCAGYARGFQYIMQQLQIPCYYCTGYAGQNHAWNIIKLDSDFYNVDVTWDDTTPATYDYFNCSDQDYAKDHVRKDLSVYLPPCNGTRYADLEENIEDIQKREQAALKELEDTLRQQQEDALKAEQEKEAAAQAKTDAETANQTTITSGSSTISISESGDEVNVNFVRSDGADVYLITTVDEYYLDCAQAMMDDDDNSISFYNQIESEKVWKQIRKAYEKGSFNAGFMERVLADKHKSSCQATITADKQSDGTYILRHIMILK